SRVGSLDPHALLPEGQPLPSSVMNARRFIIRSLRRRAQQQRRAVQPARARGSGEYRARRLLGPPPDPPNDPTVSDRRHRIGVPEFVPRERERSFLISPVKIWKRAAPHMSDQGMI